MVRLYTENIGRSENKSIESVIETRFDTHLFYFSFFALLFYCFSCKKSLVEESKTSKLVGTTENRIFFFMTESCLQGSE